MGSSRQLRNEVAGNRRFFWAFGQTYVPIGLIVWHGDYLAFRIRQVLILAKTRRPL